MLKKKQYQVITVLNKHTHDPRVSTEKSMQVMLDSLTYKVESELNSGWTCVGSAQVSHELVSQTLIRDVEDTVKVVQQYTIKLVGPKGNKVNLSEQYFDFYTGPLHPDNLEFNDYITPCLEAFFIGVCKTNSKGVYGLLIIQNPDIMSLINLVTIEYTAKTLYPMDTQKCVNDITERMSAQRAMNFQIKLNVGGDNGED